MKIDCKLKFKKEKQNTKKYMNEKKNNNKTNKQVNKHYNLKHSRNSEKYCDSREWPKCRNLIQAYWRTTYTHTHTLTHLCKMETTQIRTRHTTWEKNVKMLTLAIWVFTWTAWVYTVRFVFTIEANVSLYMYIYRFWQNVMA